VVTTVRYLSLHCLLACVVAGSLADQVTYPVRIEPADRTEEVEAKLQELLDLVGVGYLVTRWAGDAVGKKRADHKGWDHKTKWEEVLSESFPMLPLSSWCLNFIHTYALHRFGRATKNWNEQAVLPS
jgi:hypothetical protein